MYVCIYRKYTHILGYMGIDDDLSNMVRLRCTLSLLLWSSVSFAVPYVQNISPMGLVKKNDFWPTLNRNSQYVGALPVQIVPSDNKT